MSLTKRRLACPQTIQHLWDAIVSIRQQRQIPNVDRIANYMRRKHNLNPTDLERQLNFAVRDDLVSIRKCIGNKGTKVGVEQEGFRLPYEPLVPDGHDWYCFECHRGGEVVLCSSCHRVYHSFCIKEDLASSDTFTCSVCKVLTSKNTFKMKREEINCFLGYTCLRLKEKVFKKDRRVEDAILSRDLHRMPYPSEDSWHYDYLIFQNMDLNTMEEKTRANEYKRLEEFQADAQSIVHNIVIYYGVHSAMADMARHMLRDCIYDLGEIRQCRDCYRMSNEKNDKFWFCQPCNPPHELVFAKQKGFPYWPAKVIRKTNGIFDVRFFGGHHQRANIEGENIRPISTSLQKLAPKRSATQNKAIEELRKHQELLEEEIEKKMSSPGPTPAPPAAALSSNEEPDLSENETLTVPASASMDQDEMTPRKQQSVPKSSSTTSVGSVNPGVSGLAPPNLKKSNNFAASSKNAEKTKGKGGQVNRRPLYNKTEQAETDDEILPMEEEEQEEEEEESGHQQEDGDVSQDETPSSSSSQRTRILTVPTPEDHMVVTSSSQESPCVKRLLSVSTQTHKKFGLALLNLKAVKGGGAGAGSSDQQTSGCNCETKYKKMLKEQEERLEKEFRLNKDKNNHIFAEKLKSELEEEKSLEMNLALEKLHRDMESNKRKSEEEIRQAHQQDLKELQERLKIDISETKKKQWCYNCEVEAIYHCCWNTSYCSVDCQQVHWHKEHKRTCRRKR